MAYQSFREHCLPLLSSGKPFFALIHIKGGHAPLAPVAEEFLRRHSKTLPPNKAPRIATAEELAVGTADAAALQADQLAYYDANLSEADATLKQIFADFRARGLTTKTLFVITADHGESYDHGFSGDHWPSPYESTLHVPLLFYTENDAIPAGRLNDRLVSHADLVGTLAYLLGGRLDIRRTSSMNMFARMRRTSIQASSVSALSYEEDLRRLITKRKPNLMYSARVMLARHSAVAITLVCFALVLAIWVITTGLSLRRLRAVSVAVLLLLIGAVSVAMIATAGTKKDTEDLERLGVFYWARIEMMPDGIYKLLHLGRRPGLLLTRHPVRLFNVTADPAELTELLQTEPGKRPVAAQMLERARDADPFFGLFLSNLKGSEPEVRDSVKRRLDNEAIEKLKSLGY
ncbi:MAG: sulfatase-like hydrolase/transferase, partial [Thermoanaerobaculia bacterium]